MSHASNDPGPRSSAWTISGNATDEEIAAVTTVLTALARSGDLAPAATPASGWAAYWRRMNAPNVSIQP